MARTIPVPRVAITWLVDRYHVGTPDETVRADIMARVASGPNGADAWLVAACGRYAVRIHRFNRGVYSHVTGSI